jgi:transcriptional regulator
LEQGCAGRKRPLAAAHACSGSERLANARSQPRTVPGGRSSRAAIVRCPSPPAPANGFGDREILLIVQGRHGYISPSWYAPRATRAPTWNFSAAHCYGVPQILAEEENLAVLARLVEHFERHVEKPMLLDPEWGRPVARGTVGIRLPITRFVCKIKMSQDKDPVTQRQVIAALRAPGPYQHLGLADDMAAALTGD